jgi:hypothetical protein
VAGHERREKGCRGTHGVLGTTVEIGEEGEANKSKHDKRAMERTERKGNGLLQACSSLSETSFHLSSSGRI